MSQEENIFRIWGETNEGLGVVVKGVIVVPTHVVSNDRFGLLSSGNDVIVLTNNPEGYKRIPMPIPQIPGSSGLPWTREVGHSEEFLLIGKNAHNGTSFEIPVKACGIDFFRGMTIRLRGGQVFKNGMSGAALVNANGEYTGSIIKANSRGDEGLVRVLARKIRRK